LPNRYVALIMTEEIISEVKVLDSGKLLLVLKSGGDNSYQYVYREAAGVYWEQDLKGFISTEPKEWSYSMWFSHMIEIVNQIGIDLKLTSQTAFSGLDKSEQQQIFKAHTT